MSDPISNVKYQDYLEHTLYFKWNFENNNSNSRSAVLDLHDKRQCILEARYDKCQPFVSTFPFVPTIAEPQGMDKFTVSLKLDANFYFKPLEKIRVIIEFENSGYTPKLVFDLIKDNSTEFKGTQYFIPKSPFIVKDVIFEINFREHTCSALVKDFTALLDSEKFSDLTIDVGDISFKVHKNIISKRNSVLAKMIDVDMLEKQTERIILNDYKPEIVKAFLMFIYTGSYEGTSDHTELFKLAHYLQQCELQKIIAKHLKHNITMENFVSLFEIADLYEIKELYSAVETFFRANIGECVKNVLFESYLRQSIKMSNIKFVLEVAHGYTLNHALRDAIEFVRINYGEIVKDPVSRDYILNNHALLIKLFEHSVGYSPE